MKTQTHAQKRAAMLAAITRHGESLLAAFPNATERNPDTLARKLRRIETKVARPVLDYCNGDATETVVETACILALGKICKLLGLTPEQAKTVGLFVNRDPRGYALKLDDAWTKGHNLAQYQFPGGTGRPLHIDWGGYGILAPDLTPSED